MASKFVITAELNLQTGNINQVVSSLKKQFAGANVNINVKQLAAANAQLGKMSKTADEASASVGALGKGLVEATKKFTVLTLATGTFVGLARSLKNSAGEAVKFQREMVKISQATDTSLASLSGLSNEISKVSKNFGVSSTELVTAARNLVQAGFAASKVKGTLDLLAKTELAATFDSIADTTEGVIAVLNQFGKAAQRNGTEIEFLEKSLSAINQVSKDFAVESADLITAIRTTGSAFESAGGSLDELLALFTSVRATTRESAESISTGFRTIFTRVQRVDTINRLKDLGIELQDAKGKFIGPVEAVKRLSTALNSIDPRDFRFNVIVEELGGFRQVSKVIPLIQQFSVAQQALNTAQKSSGSLAKDAASAQQSLAVQISRVREEFNAFVREVVNDSSVQSFSKAVLDIASAFIKVADSLRPVMPMLLAFGGLKLGQTILPAIRYGVSQGKGFLGEAQKKHVGGQIQRFARGGVVPGTGNSDTVPAMLTPGEFVIRKSSVKKLGASTLAQMNDNGYMGGGRVVDISKFPDSVPAQTKIKGQYKDKLNPVKNDTAKLGIEREGQFSDEVYLKGYQYKKVNVSQDKQGRAFASIGTTKEYLDQIKNLPPDPITILKNNTKYSADLWEQVANLFYKGSVTSGNHPADLINGKTEAFPGIADAKFTMGNEDEAVAARKGLAYTLSKLVPGWTNTRAVEWNIPYPVQKQANGKFFADIPGLGTLTQYKKDRITVPEFTFFGVGTIDKLTKDQIKSSYEFDPSILTAEETIGRANFARNAQKKNSGGVVSLQPADKQIRENTYSVNAFSNKIIKDYKKNHADANFKVRENVWDAIFSTDINDIKQSKELSDYYARSVNLGRIKNDPSTGKSTAVPSPRALGMFAKGPKQAEEAAKLAVKAQLANATWLEQKVHDIVGGTLLGKSYYMDIIGANKGGVSGDVEVKDSMLRYQPQELAEKAISVAIDRFNKGKGQDPAMMPEIDFNSVTTKPGTSIRPNDSIKYTYRLMADKDKNLTDDQVTKAILGFKEAKKTLPADVMAARESVLSPNAPQTQKVAAEKKVQELVENSQEAADNYTYFLDKLNIRGRKAPTKDKGQWIKGALPFVNNTNGGLHPDAITFLKEVLGLTKDQLQFSKGQPVAFPKLTDAQVKDLSNRINSDPLKLNKGGFAQGTDTVPAMLTPGEFVINKKSAQKIGYGKLNTMNKVGKYANGGVVQHFSKGGVTFDPEYQKNLKAAFLPQLQPIVNPGQLKTIERILDQFIKDEKDAEAAMQFIARNLEKQKKTTGNIKLDKTFMAGAENAATRGGTLTNKKEEETKAPDFQKLANIGFVVTSLASNYSDLDNVVVKSIASFSTLYPTIQGVTQSLGGTVEKFGKSFDEKYSGIAKKFPKLGGKIELFGKGLAKASSAIAIFQAAAGAFKTAADDYSKGFTDKIKQEFQDAAKGGGGSRENVQRNARNLAISNSASQLAGAASSTTALGGAAIGSIFGPIGTIAGAAIGTAIDAAITNPINVFSQNLESTATVIFDSKKALYQFNKDLEKIGEKSLKQVSSIGTGAGNNVGKIQAQINAILRANGGTAPTTGIQGEFFQELKDELAAASQAFVRVTGELNSRVIKEMQHAASEFGKIDFAKTLKPVEDAIRASFAPMKSSAASATELALANDKEALAIAENRKVMKEAEAQILRQTAVARAEAETREKLIGSLQKEKAYRDAAAKYNFRSEGNLNSIQKLNSGNFAGPMDFERQSKSLELVRNTPEKEATLRTLEKMMPAGQGKGDVQMFRDLEKVSNGLETALSSLPSGIGSTTDLNKFFQSYFGKQGVNKDSQAIATLSKFADQIIKGQGDKNKGATPGSLSDEVKEQIVKMFSGSKEKLQERLQSFLTGLNNFSKETAAIFEGVAASSQRLIDVQMDAVDSSMRFKEAMSHITGKDVSLGEKNLARTQKLKSQTGGLTTPAAINKQIMDAMAEAKAIQEAQKNTPVQDPKEIEAVNYRLQQLNLIVDNSKKALQSLANQSDKTADILKEYDSLESKRKAFVNSLENFTFGTNEERKNMAKATAAAQQLARTGNIDSIREEDRAGASSVLDQFKDVPVFNGKTGEDVKKQVTANKAAQMIRQSGGSEADVAKAVQTIMDKTDPQKQLVKDLQKVAQDEAIVRAGLVQQETAAMGSLTTALDNTRTSFDQYNQDVLSGQKEGQAQTQQAQASLQEQGVAPATKQSADKLLAAATAADQAAVAFRNGIEILQNKISENEKKKSAEDYNNSRSYLNPRRYLPEVSQVSAGKALNSVLDPLGLYRGGLVQYRVGGGSIFKPRGTDTVPAMLSPGEYVIKKSAVDAIGVDALNDINHMAGGGYVAARRRAMQRQFAMKQNGMMGQSGSMQGYYNGSRRARLLARREERQAAKEKADKAYKEKVASEANNGQGLAPNQRVVSTVAGGTRVATDVRNWNRKAEREAREKKWAEQGATGSEYDSSNAYLEGYDRGTGDNGATANFMAQQKSPEEMAAGMKALQAKQAEQAARMANNNVYNGSTYEDNQGWWRRNFGSQDDSSWVSRNLGGVGAYRRGETGEQAEGGGVLEGIRSFGQGLGESATGLAGMGAGAIDFLGRQVGVDTGLSGAVSSVNAAAFGSGAKSDIGYYGGQLAGAALQAGAGATGGIGASKAAGQVSNVATGTLGKVGQAGRFAVNNQVTRAITNNKATRLASDNRLTRGVGSAYRGIKGWFGGAANATDEVARIPGQPFNGGERYDLISALSGDSTGQVASMFGQEANGASRIAAQMLGNGDRGLYRSIRMSPNAYKTPEEVLRAAGVPGFAKGGSVDTVPAMLTPGEFVMSKKAVDKHGVGFMNHLNKGGKIKGFNRGGVVYKQGGGEISGGSSGPAINMEMLNNIANQFAAFTNTLQNISSNLNGMSMSHTVTVDGQINIAGFNTKAVAEAIRTEVTNQVITEVKRLMGDQNNNAKDMRAS